MQMTPMETLRVTLCILCILVVRTKGDIHGSVNVGNCISSPITNKTDPSPQLITVTENVASGTLPVYFLLVNNSLPDLAGCIVLNDDVLVSCSIKKNYTNGDSIVEFVDTVIRAGQDRGEIPFSIVQQGRAVEVSCSGETVDPGTSPPLFNPDSSTGITGHVAVKKSPRVSFCEDIVVVPNSFYINEGQIQLQLSEPVADNNVTVSCEISGITQAEGDAWMYIIFDDVYAIIGTTDILMNYNIYRRGSLVLVTCRAESDNQGTQYLRNTSISAAIVFTLDTGSVQLIPEVSLTPTAKFTAFVVLNNPIKANEGEVVYNCYLNAVNDSIEAKEIAENPQCKTQEEVTEKPIPAEPVEPVVCIPIGNFTCPPGNSNSTQGTWILDESELIFTEGDVYKPIIARLDAQTTQYVGALVLTCCAAPDINTSPRFINTSAALLILSNVRGYRPVNWTEAGESITRETLFPNPAYVEMSPCPCNAVINQCETDCCCDMDCDSDDLATFSCTDGIPGGDFSINSEFSCSNVTLYTPNYWPFLCVQISNTPYLGLYYSTVAGIRDLATFNVRRNYFTDDSLTSFRDLGSRTLEFVGDENNVRLYKNGYPVEQLYDEDVRGFLSLPQQGPGGTCLWTSPLEFQTDFASTCELLPGQDLCQESSVLSARTFLQGSSVSYPACPDQPQVVSKYGSRNVAPTNVVYYCTNDASSYRVSGATSADAVHPNKPSLFSEASDEESVEESILTHPRCSWDDGYTRPPVPQYDNVTQLCHNAILDVQYELFWRGGEIISVEATILLGSIGLSQNIIVHEEEDDTIDFVPPPPITAPPTTEESEGGMMTSIIFENETEIITNVTEVFENFTFFGTEGTPDTIGTTLVVQPTTKPTTAAVTTTPTPAIPTTTPVAPTTGVGTTTPALPPPSATPPSSGGETTCKPRGDTDTCIDDGTTVSPTSSPSGQECENTGPAAFLQYFSAKFTHLPETTYDPDTGHEVDGGEQSERSGNPGYVIGSRVLTGVALYDYLTDLGCPVNDTENCTLPMSFSGTNGTFITVDDREANRLKVWGTESWFLQQRGEVKCQVDSYIFTMLNEDPVMALQATLLQNHGSERLKGSGSLCAKATVMDIPFGEDLISGCLLRLGLTELQNCSTLRETLIERLASLVPSNVIGKRGTADVSIADDWAPVFGFNDAPYESVNSTDPPGTTSEPLMTRFPGQRYVQDPAPTQIADQLSGVCYDMPTGVTIEVLMADAGENRGTVQQEILGARLTYTTSKLQLQCSGATGASCILYSTHQPSNGTNHLDNNSTTSNSTSWVQSFHITSTVTYTRVPAQEPEPLKLYRMGNSDGLCLQDICWNNALYPFTRDFQGDTFQYVLGVTLLTVFFSMGYIAITQPWLHFP